MTILICCGFGFTLGLFFKKYSQIQIVGITIILINIFLGYWAIPLVLIYAEPGGNLMNYIGYGWIFSYISKMFTESWLQIETFNLFHSSIFDLGHVYASSPVYNTDYSTTAFIVTTIAEKWAGLILVVLTAIGVNASAIICYYKFDK